jgi:hypothetical protein
MNRTRMLLLAGALLAGCQVAPERAALQPLPREVQPRPYTELLDRARVQANLANEAFMVDKWTLVEASAQELEDVARFLAQAENVPVRQKDTLVLVSGDLSKEAGKLRQAARDKNVEVANESLRKLQLTVRQLAPGPEK